MSLKIPTFRIVESFNNKKGINLDHLKTALTIQKPKPKIELNEPETFASDTQPIPPYTATLISCRNQAETRKLFHLFFEKILDDYSDSKNRQSRKSTEITLKKRFNGSIVAHYLPPREPRFTFIDTSTNKEVINKFSSIVKTLCLGKELYENGFIGIEEQSKLQELVTEYLYIMGEYLNHQQLLAK